MAVAAALLAGGAEAEAQSVRIQALLEEGDRAFARGDYQDAGKLYDRAIVAEPLTIDAAYYAKRADIFVFRKEYALGLRWVAGTAERYKPGNPLILAKKALLFESSGDHAKAVALAENLVDGGVGDYGLQLLVGDHHFARREAGADRAIAAYRAFLTSRPPQLKSADTGIQLRIGYAYLYKGEFAQARARLAGVLQVRASAENRSTLRLARAGLCAALAGLERWPQAALTCRQAIEQGNAERMDSSLHYNLAKAYLGLRRFTPALAEVDRYLQARPNAVRGHLLRGDVHAANGEWARAEAEYREAARAAPDSPDPILRMGRMHLRQSRPDADLALAELKKAYSAYPDAVDVIADLAAAHLANRQFAEARTLAQSSLPKAQGAERAPLLAAVGDSYYLEGKSFDEAATAYASAVSADPALAGARAGLVNSLNRLALAKLEANDLNGAATTLEQAIAADSTSAMSQFNLGLVLVEAGRPSAALKPLGVANQIAPTDLRVERVLARAKAATGDAAGAIEHLRKVRSSALRTGAKALAAESSAELGPLLIESGRLDEAVDMLEQAVSLAGSGASSQARANLQTAYLRRGVGRLGAGDNAGALGDLTRATQQPDALRSADSAVARFALALALANAGRAGRAVDLLTRLDRDAGSDAVPWLAPPFERQGLEFFLAYAAYTEGSINSVSRAVNILERLLSRARPGLRPRVRDLLRAAHERLAWQAYRAGRLRLASSALEKARTAGGRASPAMTHNLAVLKGGEDARRTFQRLGSRPPEALVNLGIAEEAAGDPKRAYDLWKAAREAGVRLPDLDSWLAMKRAVFGYK